MKRKTAVSTSRYSKATRTTALAAAVLAAALAGCATTSSMDNDNLAGVSELSYYQGA